MKLASDSVSSYHTKEKRKNLFQTRFLRFYIMNDAYLSYLNHVCY
jgi:hypothetical protein